MTEFERLCAGKPPAHLSDEERGELLALALPGPVSYAGTYHDDQRLGRILVVLTHPDLTDDDLALLGARRPNHLEQRALTLMALHPAFGSKALGEFARTFAEFPCWRRWGCREELNDAMAKGHARRKCDPRAALAVALCGDSDFENLISAGDFVVLIDYLTGLSAVAQELVATLCWDLQAQNGSFCADDVWDAIEISENMLANA